MIDDFTRFGGEVEWALQAADPSFSDLQRDKPHYAVVLMREVLRLRGVITVKNLQITARDLEIIGLHKEALVVRKKSKRARGGR